MKLFIATLLFSNLLLSQDKKNCLVFQFESNSSTLSESNLKQLGNISQQCRNNTIQIDSIIGYCDTVGSYGFNQNLAKKRIESVAATINKSSAKGYKIIIAGEHYPQNTTNQNDLPYWRRVEVYFSSIPESQIIQPENSNQFNSIRLDSIGSEGNLPAIVLQINFVPGLTTLLGNSQQEITNLYYFLEGNPEIFTFIRGHVCCSDDYELSDARAKVVYLALLNLGISPSRLKFQGFSNTIPKVYPEITATDESQNRRVDVVFSKTP